MAKNVFLLYGEDTYLSKQKLDSIKQRYLDASLGDTNLAVIDGETATIDQFLRQLYAMPFLAKNRLVVVANLLTKGSLTIQEKLRAELKNIPQTTVVVFYEQGNPPSSNKLFGALNLPKQTQAFNPLNPSQLTRWIRDQALKSGATLDHQAVTALVQSIGPDLWRLHNELTKLTLYTKTIAADDIANLVELPVQANIFRLLDSVGARNSVAAFQELSQLLKKGEPGLYLLAMVYRAIRTIVLAKSSHQQAAALGVHPYVLQKARRQAANFNTQDLKQLYRLLAKLDAAIKIGTIEAETAVALFVAEATKSKFEAPISKSETF